MTKNIEEIIIDGVEVDKCEFYGFSNWGNHICCPREFNKAGGCIYCNDNPNCYYKQLKRKEQECEELTEENKELHSLIDLIKTDLMKSDMENDDLRVENEKLKQTLAEIKEIAEYELNNRMLFADKKSFCDFNKILNKINEVIDD